MKLAPGLLSSLLLLAAPHSSALARAQESEQYPIVIWGKEQAASFSLRDDNEATWVQRCPEPCRLTLPQGKYHLEIFDPQGAALGTRSVKVDRSAMWTAASRNKSQRDLGLGLGIGGLALLHLGAALWLTNPDLEGGSGEETAATIGLVTVLGGAIAAPSGWLMFFGNLRPRVEVQPLGSAPFWPGTRLRKDP